MAASSSLAREAYANVCRHEGPAESSPRPYRLFFPPQLDRPQVHERSVNCPGRSHLQPVPASRQSHIADLCSLVLVPRSRAPYLSLQPRRADLDHKGIARRRVFAGGIEPDRIATRTLDLETPGRVIVGIAPVAEVLILSFQGELRAVNLRIRRA